jgi:alpha-galactosidase
MQGALGVGGNLTRWTPEEMAAATRLVSFYKTVRTTVQHGRLYRLSSPSQGGSSGEGSEVQYVSEDGSQSVVFAYLHSQHYGLPYPSIQLRGLDPKVIYAVTPLDPDKYEGGRSLPGAVLMGQGINLKMSGDYDSTALVLTRQR